MKSFDESFKVNHNSNCSYISEHPYRILIIVVRDKKNQCINENQSVPDIEKIIYTSKIHTNQSIN